MFGIDRRETDPNSVHVAGRSVATGVVRIGVRNGECGDAVRSDGDQRRLRLRVNLRCGVLHRGIDVLALRIKGQGGVPLYGARLVAGIGDQKWNADVTRKPSGAARNRDLKLTVRTFTDGSTGGGRR